MPELIQSLALAAPEEGTFAITVNFLDDAAAAVVPTSATWTLTSLAGAVINSRLAVAIPALAASKTILLQNDDLAINEDGVERHLLVEYVYTSSLGTGLRGKSVVAFKIQNFVAVR